MKHSQHENSTFRIGAGKVKILIDLFRSDNPSGDYGWSSFFKGKNPMQGGDR